MNSVVKHDEFFNEMGSSRNGVTSFNDITINNVRSATQGQGRRGLQSGRRVLQSATDAAIDFTVTSDQQIAFAFARLDFVAQFVSAVNAAGENDGFCIKNDEFCIQT